MSLLRYESYKQGGVEWLGEVPSHWSCARLRWLTNRYAGGTPDKANQEYWTDGTVPWLNSGAVNQSVINKASAYITQTAYENSSAKWVPKGALVMALAGQGKTKGMVARLAIAATCNQSMAAIVPREGVSSPFLFWWLTSNYQNIRNMAGGDLRDGLNLELLGDVPCPTMPLQEQLAIADFLNRETAKIDALVQEQQRLIELWKEKRQAVISHAVTRGLDPNVPMKVSGLEWLEDVPQHWGSSIKLNDLAAKTRHSFVNGPFGSDLLTEELIPDGVPVIYIRDLKQYGYRRVSEWCVPGLAVVYPQGEPNAIITQDVIRLRVNETIARASWFIYSIRISGEYRSTLFQWTRRERVSDLENINNSNVSFRLRPNSAASHLSSTMRQ